MVFNLVVSWLVNFVIISVLLALVDEYIGHIVERHGWLSFLVAIILPLVIELLAFSMQGKSFLELVLMMLGFL